MKRAWPLLGLALLTFLVFRPVLHFQFLTWDDDVNITANPMVLGQHYVLIWTRFYYGLFVPLAYTLWSLLASLSYEPWLFHLLNLAVHTVNVILVFLLLNRRLSLASVPAFLGATLFAIHPLQVETVAWVSGFRDLGAVGMALASLYIFLSRRKEGAALVLFALGLLIKPSIVMIPLLAFWLDGRGLRKSFWLWLMVAALAVGVSAMAQRDLGATTSETWAWRIAVAADALLFYLYKMAWPFQLAVDYGKRPALALNLNTFCFFGLLPLLFALWWRAGRRAFVFILLALLPTLGLVPFAFQYVSTVADHYAYFAMVGAAWWFGEWTSSRAGRLVGIAGLVIFGGVAHARLPVWREDSFFYEAMIQSNPRSFSGLVGRADLERQKGQIEVAIADYRRALEIEPTLGSAILNLTASLSMQKRDAELLRLLKPVLEKPLHLSPANRSYYANLFYFAGVAHTRLNQPDEAFFNLCRAFQIRPDSADLAKALSEAQHQLSLPKECL